MKKTLNENEVIRLIAKGDEQAFEQLFRSWYAFLVVYARRYLNDRQEAENSVQMVFIKLWEKRKVLKIESLKAYLTIAVRNECINELKRQQQYQKVEAQLKVDDFSDSDLPDEKLLNRISEAIEAMPGERKRIFKMARFEGKKYKEIASSLNISVKTVEAQMGKALKSLRQTFNPAKIEEVKEKYRIK